MKKTMRSTIATFTVLAMLAIAVADAATPRSAEAQLSVLCAGDSAPICGERKTCVGILWWKRCQTDSFYWDVQ